MEYDDIDGIIYHLSHFNGLVLTNESNVCTVLPDFGTKKAVFSFL